MNTTVAGIDCGTNSIRLLIATVGADGHLQDVVRQMRIVRLGQGVDVHRAFAPEALERTFAACDEYASLLQEHQVEKVRFVATSATRDAQNRQEFLDGVMKRLGVLPEVISGLEEAELSFRGAIGSFPPVDVPPPTLVVDIGGGSTEFILGTDTPQESVSVDMGCVRMTERHFAGLPEPTPVAAVRAATVDIDAAIARASTVVPLQQARTLVAVAGTATTVAAMCLGLTEYDPHRIHGARLSATQIQDMSHQLQTLTAAQRREIPVLHPGRADVITAGALVLARIVAAVGVQWVRVSEHDILDGIALSLLPNVAAT